MQSFFHPSSKEISNQHGDHSRFGINMWPSTGDNTPLERQHIRCILLKFSWHIQANTLCRTSVCDTSRLVFESPVGWQAAVRRFKSGSTSFCRLPQHFFLFKTSRKRFEQSANPFQTPSMNTELSHPSSEFSHKHKEMRPSGNNMWIV